MSLRKNTNNSIKTVTLHVICVPTQNMLLKCAIPFQMELVTFSTNLLEVKSHLSV